MCRKKYMRGWCLIAFGLGLIVGHCLESWVLSCCGGMAIIALGFVVLGQR